MPDDELDRILSQDEIQPSPIFAAKVMQAVRREAAAPPPIRFPWKLALPGMAAGVGVIVAALQAPPAPIPAGWIETAKRLDLSWLAVSLLASAVALLVSRRLARD